MENEKVFLEQLRQIKSETERIRIVLQAYLPESLTPIKPNGISFDEAYELAKQIREMQNDIQKLWAIVDAYKKIDAAPGIVATIAEAWTSTQFVNSADSARFILFHLQRKYEIWPKSEPRLAPRKQGD